MNLCIVEGERSITTALDSGASCKYVVVTDSFLHQASLNNFAKQYLYACTDGEMKDLSSVNQPPGILGVFETAFASLEKISAKRIVCLDGVQDPGNVGTILRTCAWFGIDAVLVGKGTVDFFNEKVIRASMGGIWNVNLVQVLNLEASLDILKNQGYVCYGASMGGEKWQNWKPAPKSVLVLGNEAKGITESILSKMDKVVGIASFDTTPVESLNVSIAGGILMAKWCASY